MEDALSMPRRVQGRMNAAISAPNKLVSLVRWILVPPTAYVAWTIALLVGLAIFGSIDWVCPVDQQASGHCVAPWYPAASQAVFRARGTVGGCRAIELLR
jgi:hypothetical protein